MAWLRIAQRSSSHCETMRKFSAATADVQRRSGPFAQVPFRQLKWGFLFRPPFGLMLAPSRQPGSHEVASPVIGQGEGG
jgi:hypothetical protein